MASEISETFQYFRTKLKDILDNELLSFVNSTNCCKTFPKFVTNAQRFYIEHFCLIRDNLHFRVRQKNGIKFVKVYKTTCNNFLGDEETVQLSSGSRQALTKFFETNPLTTTEKFEMFPFFCNSSYYAKDLIPIQSFSIGDRKAAEIPENMASHLLNDSRNDIHEIEKYRHEILSAIDQNHVTIISGDKEFEKSTKIPEFILKCAAERKEPCRIICAHTHQVSAIFESQLLVSKYESSIGSTIGYQVHLDSRASTSTCLLYTTNQFILRCMLRGSLKDVFKNVTHLILNNSHLRESHCDIVVTEIRKAITRFPHLKLILLCDPENEERYMQFIENAKLVKLGTFSRVVTILYLEEILNFLYNSAEKNVSPEEHTYFDYWLEQYINTDGCDKVFNQIFYHINEKVFPVDMMHSETKMTILMAAMANNKVHHVTSLLSLNADYDLCDRNNQSALTWGLMNHSEDCIKLLNFKMIDQLNEKAQQKKLLDYLNSRPNDDVDHALVFAVVQYIISFKEKGIILIFLPTINDVLIQECIVKEYLTISIKIQILHEYIPQNDLENLFKPNSNGTIFLATDLAESAFSHLRARYVIDTGKRIKKMIPLDVENSNGEENWISTESMSRRMGFLEANIPGYCFRLYSKTQAKAFVASRRYELPNTSIDKIFVFAKLLSESGNIKNYFQSGLFQLSEQTIQSTLKFLKCIQVLDPQENISIMGARLIDIHPDFQLAKVIMFGIALQCLDPVLSIVAALTYSNPFILPSDHDSSGELCLTRKSLSEANNSDHLILLRLFQKFQAGTNTDIQGNVENEIVSKIFEAITNIRAGFISALRSVKLIHTSGPLSMQGLNKHSFNWAQVKLCFVIGMYPNVGKIDNETAQIKSNFTETLDFHPVSVLKEIPAKSVNNDQPHWIVFQDHMFGSDSSNLSCSSLITAITIAIFGGQMKLIDGDMPLLSLTGNSSNMNGQEMCRDYVRFHVDDWISFNISSQDGRLILNLRKKFFHHLEQIFKYCNDQNHVKRHLIFANNFTLIKTISKVLEYEEQESKLPLPENVGLRPKVRVYHQPNQLRALPPAPNSSVSEIKDNNSRVETNSIDHYYIVRVSNEVQVKHLIEGTFSLSHFPLNEIFKEIEKSNSSAVVFFFISNMEVFNAAAVFCPTGDPKLRQINFACVPLCRLQDLYWKYRQNFDENFTLFKLPSHIGIAFLQLFIPIPGK